MSESEDRLAEAKKVRDEIARRGDVLLSTSESPAFVYILPSMNWLVVEVERLKGRVEELEQLVSESCGCIGST
jgi:hypothetical protein